MVEFLNALWMKKKVTTYPASHVREIGSNLGFVLDVVCAHRRKRDECTGIE